MQVNWFTFIAQIINFLILVWLLQRFLYGPITKAMQQRQQNIKETLDQAEEKRQQAQQEAAKYHQQIEELATQREQTLAQVKQETEQERQALLRQVRQEVEEIQSRWYQAVEIERQAFLQNLRRRTAEEINTVVRRTLADLANTELEEQIVDVFLERLQQLEPKALAEIVQSIGQGRNITIKSAFDLSPAKRQKIIELIEQQIAPEANIQFKTAEDLVCGIHLTAANQEITWSFASYLQTLEESLSTAMEKARRPESERELQTIGHIAQ